MIGEGGMGSVWVADHRTLHTQVAVKFMSEHLFRSPKRPRVSVARRAPRLRSSRLTWCRFSTTVRRWPGPVHRDGAARGRDSVELHQTPPRRTSARGRGADRHSNVQSARPRALPPRDSSGHKTREHFLVDSDGEIFVKLLDFGVAKRLEENVNVTSTGAVMGTAYYMSPEQMMSSKHVDARSDLWAVGVVAYQCVTGQMPFDGETFAGIAVAVSQGQFSMPFAGQGVGSAQLDAWFARALAREQAQRFASAREMAEAFSAAVSVGGVRAGTLGNFGGSPTANARSWSDTSTRQGPDPPDGSTNLHRRDGDDERLVAPRSLRGGGDCRPRTGFRRDRRRRVHSHACKRRQARTRRDRARSTAGPRAAAQARARSRSERSGGARAEARGHARRGSAGCAGQSSYESTGTSAAEEGRRATAAPRPVVADQGADPKTAGGSRDHRSWILTRVRSAPLSRWSSDLDRVPACNLHYERQLAGGCGALRTGSGAGARHDGSRG